MFILSGLGEGEETRREKRGKSGGKMAVPTLRDVQVAFKTFGVPADGNGSIQEATSCR